MPEKSNRDELAKRLSQRQVVQPHNPVDAVREALTQESTQEREQEGTLEVKRVRTHARTKEGKHIRKDVDMDWLYDRIQQRKHLSNGSFRYRPDELDTMDAIYHELEDKKPGRISKNDLARMALIVLCQDYQDNGEQSTLAQIFQRM